LEKDSTGKWNDTFMGSWLSSFILTPLAVLLTYRATNDIGLINMDVILTIQKVIKKNSVTKLTIQMITKIQLNTIEEAIEDIRQGKIIIVVDDEDREKRIFLAAAEK
jgi:hypothetical protein